MPGLALLILITVALGFEFINGFHDTANAIAVLIHTGALSAGRAVALAAVMNLLGAFASENVARTISGELISAAIDEYTIIAALIAAIIWNLFTWYLGMPASSSHALIGALIGAFGCFYGKYGRRALEKPSLKSGASIVFMSSGRLCSRRAGIFIYKKGKQDNADSGFCLCCVFTRRKRCSENYGNNYFSPCRQRNTV